MVVIVVVILLLLLAALAGADLLMSHISADDLTRMGVQKQR
jgi:hypothetical protein